MPIEFENDGVAQLYKLSAPLCVRLATIRAGVLVLILEVDWLKCLLDGLSECGANVLNVVAKIPRKSAALKVALLASILILDNYPILSVDWVVLDQV